MTETHTHTHSLSLLHYYIFPDCTNCVALNLYYFNCKMLNTDAKWRMHF